MITGQFQEQCTIMNRLEAELAQTQQALILSREEMNEYQASQSRAQGAIIRELKEELGQAQQALIQSREEMSAMEEHQASQSQAQSVIIDRLKEELTQAQQALVQHQHEMVTRTEYQRVVKELKDMTTIEGETYAVLTRAQEKTKKVQTQLEEALEKIKHICDVYSDAINYRAPATNYVLFLLEQYLLLTVKTIRASKPISFATVPEFISCFRDQEEKVQYLLCELYFHNLIMDEVRGDNSGLFIGDIQFYANFPWFFQK
jgi:hypothetical protein